MVSRRTHHRVAVALVAAIASSVTGACTAAHTDPGRAPIALVHMIDYGFVPANLSVPMEATITVVNDGKVPHSWIIPKVGVGTQDLAPGQSQNLDLSGIAPGTYTVTCDLPGHAKLGSVGTVTITR